MSRPWVEGSLVAVAALAMCVLIFFTSPPRTVYDEGPFRANLELMNDRGLTREFLVEMREQSPGPLYQVVHAAAQPITGGDIRRMRLVNAACLFGAILALALLFAHRGAAVSLASAGQMMAIPGVWVVGGMALTESPAMLFVSSGIVLFLLTMRTPRSLLGDMALTAIAGTLVAFAILGRQPYLMIPVVVWVMAFQAGRRELVLLLTFTLFASAVPLLVFAVWGGLVPPLVGSLQSGLNLYYPLLGFGYAGVFTLFLAPRWFRLNRPILGGCFVIAAVGVGINVWTRTVQHLPMASVATPLLGPASADFVALAFPVLFVVFGLFFLASALIHLRLRYRNAEFAFVTLAALAILLTCAKSSAQFSSRYVVQAAPFLVAMTSEFAPAGTSRAVRLIAGAALGASSLLSYYG